MIALLLLFPIFTFSQEINLQFWHSMGGEKGKLLSEIAEGFNKENEGKIRIRLQYVGGYEETLNKLRTALLSKTEPHIIQITDIGTKVMIDSMAITPLQDFIDKDPSFPIDKIFQPIRHYYESNGRMNSLPFATSNPILFYNADAFAKAGIKEPPRTFEELEEIAEKLTDRSKKIVGITWPLNSWFFEEFSALQGATFVNPDNGRNGLAKTANFLSPEGIRFVSLWDRMVKKGIFANVGRGWDPAEQNFLAGRAMMMITSTSETIEVSKQVPFKLGTAPIPGKGNNGGTIIGGNSLWLLKNKPDDQKKAAYEFLKYMAGAPAQEKWHSNTGYFPIRGDVIEILRAKGFYEKYPGALTAIDQMRTSPLAFPTQGGFMSVFPEVREHINTAIEEVLAGQATVEQALTKASSKTNYSLMRSNRGKEK